MNNNDFTRPLAELIAALEGRVRLGVEQPRDVVAIFKHSLSSYELPADTVDVSRVAGWRGQRFGPFAPLQDYSFGGGRLQWLGAPADEGTRLEIETVWREPPSGLTDFNPGSVAGTLLRAVARELALMYAQVDEAYRRAFIDDASGVALDNVVALLGVQRSPAQAARGFVTFSRRKPATQPVLVPAGTRVADRAGRSFATVADAQIRTAAEELVSASGSVLQVADQVGAVIGVWPRAANPDTAAPLALAPPLPANQPQDPRSIRLAAAVAPGTALRVRYKPLSVRVAVLAQQAGPDGNVNAASLTLMPTPPRDVDAVTNEDATEGGQLAEDDERLRERAKHALERAGNATLNAIRFAVLQVQGVQGVEVVDHARDDSIPLGELRVRYAGAESDALHDAVTAAVNASRAAGVMARVEKITTVHVSGVFYLVPAETQDAAAPAAFVAAASGLVNALQIGQPLGLRKLQAISYTLPGLADLAEPQLLAHKPLASSPGVLVAGDALLAAGNELVRAHPTGLRAVLLAGLVAVAHRRLAAGRYQIDLQLQDAQGQVPAWRALSLDLFVSVRAQLQNNPTETPVRVGAFTRNVRFNAGPTAQLDFTVATDLPGFTAAEHVHAVQINISAAAYAGLRAAQRTVDVTV
jgi:uncharacterized phage protein gp47/JayE